MYNNERMEIKKEATAVSIQVVRSLVRHPWLFTCPFVMIFSLTFSYASLSPAVYESSGAVSFKVASGNVLANKSDERKKDIVKSLYFGKNLKKIIKDVWPNEDEKKNPASYSSKARRIRSQISGIVLKYDKRDPSILIVSFADGDPKLCYNVVKAVIARLKEGGKAVSEETIEAGLVFLKQQLSFYKDKLRAIDEEASKLKVKLQGMSSHLNPEERSLISEVTSNASFKESSGQILIQQSVKYEEMLAGLNLELMEANKKKDSITKRLEIKDYSTTPLSYQECMQDATIKQYEEQIAVKRLALANLISKGYTPEHPDARKLSSAINDLASLQEERVRKLTGMDDQELSGSDKNLAEGMMRSELVSVNSQIEMLKSKIDLISGYQRSSEDRLNSSSSSLSPAVSADASKLMELRNERVINFKYYVDIRKQLEEVEMKERAEEANMGLSVDVVDQPRVPKNPNSQKKGSQIIMGLLIAIGAGAGLAYIVDYMDKSPRSPNELRNILKIPVLASIERMLTAEEIRRQKMRRRIVILGLFLFVILSNIIMKVLS
ncbi:MAG: hypothetical protein NTZ95_03740 [Candidatus Omnitrophica bacterium]|nr:hypothetical protein [Candidatus Omnitrophota bacterium]